MAESTPEVEPIRPKKGLSPAEVARLTEAARSGDPRKRFDAIFRLGMGKAPEARRLFANALGDSDPDVRLVAAASLVRLGEVRHLTVVKERFLEGRQAASPPRWNGSRADGTVIKVLEIAEYPQTRGLIKELLGTEEDPLVRVALAEVLLRGYRDEEAALPPLRSVFKDDQAPTAHRKRVLIAVYQVRDEGVYDAARGLVERQGPGPGRCDVIPLVGKPDPDMLPICELRGMAVGYLGRFPERGETGPLLLRIAENETLSEVERAAAIDQIAELKMTGAIPLLRSLVGHADPRLREAASEALMVLLPHSTGDH